MGDSKSNKKYCLNSISFKTFGIIIFLSELISVIMNIILLVITSWNYLKKTIKTLNIIFLLIIALTTFINIILFCSIKKIKKEVIRKYQSKVVAIIFLILFYLSIIIFNIYNAIYLSLHLHIADYPEYGGRERDQAYIDAHPTEFGNVSLKEFIIVATCPSVICFLNLLSIIISILLRSKIKLIYNKEIKRFSIVNTNRNIHSQNHKHKKHKKRRNSVNNIESTDAFNKCLNTKNNNTNNNEINSILPSENISKRKNKILKINNDSICISPSENISKGKNEILKINSGSILINPSENIAKRKYEIVKINLEDSNINNSIFPSENISKGKNEIIKINNDSFCFSPSENRDKRKKENNIIINNDSSSPSENKPKRKKENIKINNDSSSLSDSASKGKNEIIKIKVNDVEDEDECEYEISQKKTTEQKMNEEKNENNANIKEYKEKLPGKSLFGGRKIKVSDKDTLKVDNLSLPKKI